MKKFFTLISVALMGLAGCTFEDGNDNGTNYTQDVFIRFENAGQPATRIEEASKGNVDKVSFASGYIFFITAQNSIKKCYRIAPTGTGSDLPNHVISIDDFWDVAATSGYLFQNVSGEVTQVYIIGNVPEDGTTAESVIRSKTTLEELKKIAIPVGAQSNVDVVTLDGIDSALESINGDVTKKKADITLTPLCSRIEIAKFTSTGAVTDYKLQGIYASHFYNSMPLNETSVADNLEIYATNGGTDYGVYPSMCDKAATGAQQLGTKQNAVTTPATAGNVWAYQFLPGSDNDRISPRLVIELNGVISTIGNFNASQTYYLNIRGFKNSGAAPNAVPMSVTRGKVFKIANVSFDESDISDIPNPADINLTVTVSVAEWEVVTVEPVM